MQPSIVNIKSNSIHKQHSPVQPLSFARNKVHILILYLGRAIAQAVSRRLPTAAARVRAQVRLCGISGV
jgi:hypothetical protein